MKTDNSLFLVSIFGVLLGGVALLSGYAKYPLVILYFMLVLVLLPAILKKNLPISTAGILLSILLVYFAVESIKGLSASTLLLVAFELGLIGMYIEIIWRR
ncbi:hypothetical protein OCC_09174 [Thermococcus litoralis DSM 5473]|uniref:Uncharacterized protein n=1 Tax=Thermococcus litoralis (strain ATCC 51850 / DSM 5473 / JCM 8560 / NS-C) TaxID=523849 RepID=H3ZKF3_THELN|nr:hypothetical protein [Thermococcus litoralis]EHR79555.1 hypothetical protein OCC_09174 [Thermococcus litoralis DSM 5473]